MSYRILTLLLSGAIGLSVTGCASISPDIRAQSPGYQPTGWEHGGHGVHAGHGHSCPTCQMGATGHQGHHPDELINLPGHPVHRNSYTYNVPKGLMYPPAPSQAGVYQYPYYTFRGPTDFFQK